MDWATWCGGGGGIGRRRFSSPPGPFEAASRRAVETLVVGRVQCERRLLTAVERQAVSHALAMGKLCDVAFRDGDAKRSFRRRWLREHRAILRATPIWDSVAWDNHSTAWVNRRDERLGFLI